MVALITPKRGTITTTYGSICPLTLHSGETWKRVELHYVANPVSLELLFEGNVLPPLPLLPPSPPSPSFHPLSSLPLPPPSLYWYWLRSEWLCIPFKPDFSFREVWSTDCSYVHKMLLGQCVRMGHGESSTFALGSSGTSEQGTPVCPHGPRWVQYFCVGFLRYFRTRHTSVSTWATVSPVLLCWVPPVLQNKAHQCVHMGHGESSTFVSGSSSTSREACVCKQAISTQGTRILTQPRRNFNFVLACNVCMRIFSWVMSLTYHSIVSSSKDLFHWPHLSHSLIPRPHAQLFLKTPPSPLLLCCTASNRKLGMAWEHEQFPG